jgi:hypothetical protein
MSGGMPYYLEKGPMLTLMENYINGQGQTKRETLQVLRDAEADPGAIGWVAQVFPGLCAEAEQKGPPGMSPHDHVLKHWFGYEPAGDGGAWRLRTTPTTGFWIDYKGDVNSIVRKTLRWALEISLGLMPDEDRPGRPDPDPIEFFWMCNTNWFEGWVMQRPTGHGGRMVTVLFATPGHTGAVVATSPIAVEAKVMPQGFPHAVPSLQADYELLGVQADPPPNRPRAVDRPFATWVVTHSYNHAVQTPVQTPANNAAPSAPGTGYAQHAVYHGTDQTVIVSPSFPAGGVPYDHWIRT